ncbi:MAG: ABC transporter permease [bacterium]
MPRPRPVLAWIALGVMAVIWQLAATLQDDFIFLPKPVDVLDAFLAMAASGELALHVQASLGRLLAGYASGVVFGIGLGLAMALNNTARAACLPLVSALFALPKVALLPLFIVWFGIGEEAKILTIAIGVFSPVVLATYGGIDGVDRGLIRMAQSFDLSSYRIVISVLLPGALPALLTGLRMAGAIAIVLLVSSEMIGARYGIGALALTSGGLMRTDRLFVALVLLALLGIGFSLTVSLAERILLNWR